VLTRADPFPADRLADIVAYIESLPPPPPDPRAGRVAGADTGAVARGRAIFERTKRRDGAPIPEADRCVSCHAPPHFSNLRRAGVGTQGDRDDTGTFDVPHLTGIGSKAPYLHDGRALSLEAIWTAPDVGDLHGQVTDLTKADLNDLVEFMKGL
jgi:cytochrome c553